MTRFLTARRFALLFTLTCLVVFAVSQLMPRNAAREYSRASGGALSRPLHAAQVFSVAAQNETDITPKAGTWFARGTLLEACTCAVPCTCNFGEGPSPHGYCHAAYSYQLDLASYDGIDLSGLVVGGVDGGGSQSAGFLDERATPAQRAALQKLALAIFAQGGPAPGARPFASARITHRIAVNHLTLQIKSSDTKVRGDGGFSARLIMGRDGKNPVVVENNTVWPIERAIKGKTTSLRYSDALGNRIQTSNSNANYGAFRFSGDTARFAALASTRAAKITTKVADAKGAKRGCCPPQKDGKMACHPAA